MRDEREERYPNTDLACERMRADTSLPGVDYTEEKEGDTVISRLVIDSDEGEEAIGKPRGSYVTVSFPPLWELDEKRISHLSHRLAELILEFVARIFPSPTSVLVAGLGNRAITADAIGPESVSRMIATRHLSSEDPELFARFADCELSLLAPGVLGETGIEAAELVASASRTVGAGLVVVIDALAARATERLAATVQLSDTGIRPGSGIRNARRALDADLLGVPCLAIGVPTVVGSATLVHDAFERAGIGEEKIPEEVEKVLHGGRSFFVSPREIDLVTERAARLLGDAVNLAFSPRLFESEQ